MHCSACDWPTCLVCRMSGDVPVPVLAHLRVRTFHSRFRPTQPRLLAPSLNLYSYLYLFFSLYLYLRSFSLSIAYSNPTQPTNFHLQISHSLVPSLNLSLYFYLSLYLYLHIFVFALSIADLNQPNLPSLQIPGQVPLNSTSLRGNQDFHSCSTCAWTSQYSITRNFFLQMSRAAGVFCFVSQG